MNRRAVERAYMAAFIATNLVMIALLVTGPHARGTYATLVIANVWIAAGEIIRHLADACERDIRRQQERDEP